MTILEKDCQRPGTKQNGGLKIGVSMVTTKALVTNERQQPRVVRTRRQRIEMGAKDKAVDEAVLLTVDRYTHTSFFSCTFTHNRATQRVCVRASFHLHVIHDVCLSVRCLSLCVCPSPVSLRRLPLLFHSTCTLTSTSSQMSTASRELTTAPSHNDFELLDARIALALNKIIQNTRFKKKVSLEEMKAHKEDR